ncbi:MAG: UDP-N-acetylmuramoyl-tripeptide--D-alanyl-D-alanine ligase, partial [Bacteroidetes bacterium]|nr:UDP-N-acetylmuramoyl-tripeptide--D-alanyl-D-alanine ligase [Bacteroidota bacterium]
MSITLADIASKLNTTVNGESTRIIDGLSIDSRTIFPSKNMLFIALKGERNDGHDYIPELIKKGIVNFITEKPLLHKDISSIIVNDSKEALQQIASLKRTKYTGEVIAITGSNGKTTVKEWIWSCLSDQQNVFRSPKSYNSQVGVPLSVWGINGQYQTAIIEAGISRPGEMHALQQIIRPTIGIFTTLGDAHQQHFNSWQEKLDEKIQLFKETHTIFYNGDEQLVNETLESAYPEKKHITYSRIKDNAFLHITDEKSTPDGYRLYLTNGSDSFTLNLPFQDKASVENLIMVCQVLLYYGWSFEDIQKQFNKLEPVAMRLQQLSGYNNCTIINDSYNSDLTSVKIAIDFLMQQKQHQQTVFILSDITQSGFSKRELYAQVAELVIQHKITQFIGIGQDMAEYRNLFPPNSRFFKNTGAFLQQLNDEPVKDATLLIKGARMYGFERIVQALEMKQHRTVLEIDYNAVIHNLNYYKSLLNPGTKMLVMVKALAYGSGGIEIARLLQHQRVDYLAVAFADEGVELRKSGITAPILVMNPSGLDFQTIVDH